MAPTGTAVTPALASWIGEQRWFANTAAKAALSAVGGYPLGDAEVLLVHDAAPGAEALYQVPLAGGDAEPTDGMRRLDAIAQLVGLALGAGSAGGGEVDVRGESIGWTGPAPAVRTARVLSGEQSNTSVIVAAERADGTPVDLMVKLFRALHDGANPDVVLQSAIAGAGSRRVPATYGALVGRWRDPRAGRAAEGHLAVVQEFLPDTRDAWRVALDAARAGTDFTAAARDLGAATAEVHRVLADVLPTVRATGSAHAATRTSMAARAERAVRYVPGLADLAERIDAVLDAGADGAWPDLQRVHGDYHLGQVLLVPDRGWVLLDFEGEPLRPMAERSEPDLALRDVAGMLRSFDYVAGAIAQERGDATAWAAAARGAFLAGYETELGAPLAPFSALLTALELDKALYECEYEARNRPDWLPIPEGAVRRLVGTAA